MSLTAVELIGFEFGDETQAWGRGMGGSSGSATDTYVQRSIE